MARDGAQVAGRRRDPLVRDSILDAAWQLVRESGYAAATVERIAERAGSGKTTIYRWWRGRPDVLLEALSRQASREITDPSGSSFEIDLREFLDATYAMGRNDTVLSVLRALMAEAQVNDEFSPHFLDGFLPDRRAALRRVIDRARGRGDFPSGIEPELAIDVIFGTLWYRVLARHASLDGQLADSLIALLTSQTQSPR